MRRSHTRDGYALLMTLVVVLLAGVAMVGLAQRSLSGALETRSAEHELRRRWAVASMRAVLLGRLGRVMDGLERPDPNAPVPLAPTPQQRLTLRLAGLDYELVVTDEQAKLNVNTILDGRTRGEAQATLRDIIARTAPNPPVVLRPTRRRREVFGYGQLFDGVSPGRLVAERPGDALTRDVTCWGDGKVNIARASDVVIRRHCREKTGPRVVRMLLEGRRRNPTAGLSELLRDADDISREDRRSLRGLLTDRSRCHGLWIIARTDERKWYTLAVSVTSDDRIVQWYEYSW